MAVNESVYGSKSKWKTLFTQTGVPTDEQLLKGIFLDEQYPSGSSYDERSGYCLGNALWREDNDNSYSVADPNNPNLIEPSCTFVGIAGDSPYTKIKYISNQYTDYPIPDPQSIVDLGTDTFEVVNTFFTPTSFANFGNNKPSIEFFYEDNVGDSQSIPNYKQVMWSPDKVTGHVIGSTYTKYYAFDNGWNDRNNIGVVTQLPTHRLVWYPTITCCDNNGSNVGTYDMTTYLNTHKASKPRILSVQMKAVMDLRPDMTTGTLNRSTSVPLMGLGLNMVLHGEFDGYFVGRIGERTEISSEKPVVQLAVGSGRGVALGGYLTGVRGSYNSNIGTPTNNGKEFSVQSIIDCGVLEWNRWSGTGEGYVTQYLYCDVSEISNNDIIRSIRRAIACFGMFFADNENNARTKNLDDAGMFLGIIDNGIGYGDYSEGILNREQPQWDWKDMSESPYDPVNPQPQTPIPPSDPTTFNPVTLANGGLKRYVLDGANMASFGRELWNVIDTTNPDELIQNQTLSNFLTNNPLDCIVSIKRFPLADMSQGSAVNPMLGKVKIQNVLAYPFDASSTILSCGSLAVPRFFNDFRDYMVQYELILPFCGTLSLDAESITGKTIDIKYAIDYTTGTCTAWILTTTSDGAEIVIDSANGNCCIDIPMSGVQTATLTGQIYNANENLKTAKFNTIISGVTGVGDFVQNVREHNTSSLIKSGANLINDIHNIKKAEWNINHTEIPLKMIGASSGCNSFQIELTPRLTAYVPKTVVGFNYADYLHTVGASVCDSCTIGNYSGYVEVSNIDLLGFVATTTEKTMITNLLANGVYL